MRIGILEAGNPPDRLAGRYPSYGRMTAKLLRDPDGITIFAIAEGDWPSDPGAFDAFLITGSPAGVYDALPWIANLIMLLRGLDPRTKLVGLCFGHQVMAQAFGGQVRKSEKGWGLGLHRYDVYECAPWMDCAAQVAVAAIHQDQVVELPSSARILAGSTFTPCGILAYTDRAAISFQCHPEFERDYAEALIAGHRPMAPHDPAFHAAAIDSLNGPTDSARVGGWIRRFLGLK